MDIFKVILTNNNRLIYLFSIRPLNLDESVNVSDCGNVIGNERFEPSLELNRLRSVPKDEVKQLLDFRLKYIKIDFFIFGS